MLKVYKCICSELSAFPKDMERRVACWAQLFKTNDVVSWRIVKTLIIKYGIYTKIFVEKMWKATKNFSSKITCEFDIVLTRTVNIMTTNELV